MILLLTHSAAVRFKNQAGREVKHRNQPLMVMMVQVNQLKLHFQVGLLKVTMAAMVMVQIMKVPAVAEVQVLLGKTLTLQEMVVTVE